MRPTTRSDVMDHPRHPLKGTVAEVDDRRDKHELEVPGDWLPFLFSQDRAARGAFPLRAEVFVLDQCVTLFAPGHYLPPIRTRSFMGAEPNSNFSRSPRSM